MLSLEIVGKYQKLICPTSAPAVKQGSEIPMHLCPIHDQIMDDVVMGDDNGYPQPGHEPCHDLLMIGQLLVYTNAVQGDLSLHRTLV